MLARMTAADFGGWKALYAAEPWGWREEWRRHAQTAYYSAAAAFDLSNKNLTVEDFVPKRVEAEAVPVDEPPLREGARILRNMEAFKLALGVKDNRRRPRYE